MSFGQIYCTTWFGHHANVVYSLPVPPNPECLFQDETTAYDTRVTTDGGTTEALQCVDQFIYELKY